MPRKSTRKSADPAKLAARIVAEHLSRGGGPNQWRLSGLCAHYKASAIVREKAAHLLGLAMGRRLGGAK